MIPVAALLAKDGVVESDMELPLALNLLAESDGSVLPDLKSPLIGVVETRRLKLNLPSILFPTFRPLDPRSGFKQVSRIVEDNPAIATPFCTLQKSGDSTVRSNLCIR